MSTLVAGRVDDEVKARADIYIERAGMTSASVIRAVWESIAETGSIPAAPEKDPAGSDLMGRMRSLRARTPRSAFLEQLTPEGLKEELGNRG